MIRKSALILLVAAIGLAACAPLAVPEPTAAPTATLPARPPATATPAPDDPVSVTPGGPISQPEPRPFEPQPGDKAMVRGEVWLDEIDLSIAESYPVQIFLHLGGALPTPCHQLRVRVAPPDSRNRIMIEAYSVVAADLACIQVLEPLNVNVALGSFPPGDYTVWVNGAEIGKFTS